MAQSLPDIDLTTLSRRYRGALVAYFLRAFGDAAQAEDLTQEVFVRLAGLAARGEIGNVEGYVFRVAKNLVRDTRRRRSVRLTYFSAAFEDKERGIDAQDAERVVMAREALARVLKVLDRMPERTRSIFILYRLEAMPRKDIADAFGITVSAVEKHLAKVMGLLLSEED